MIFKAKDSKEEYSYRYEVDEAGLERILEAIHDFNTNYIPIGINSYNRWDQESSLNSSDYLRGIAVTLPNGERLEMIAEVLESIRDMFFHVCVTKTKIEKGAGEQ